MAVNTPLTPHKQKLMAWVGDEDRPDRPSRNRDIGLSRRFPSGTSDKG